jgi:hypothetical protein
VDLGLQLAHARGLVGGRRPGLASAFSRRRGGRGGAEGEQQRRNERG